MNMNFKDLTGKKFGRLTVIERVSNNKWGQTKWLCQCDCGKKKIIYGGSLTRKIESTKSCGCLRNETAGGLNKLNPGLAMMRAKISQYKYSAKKKGHIWDLTEEQFAEITKKNCFYCGGKPKQTCKANKRVNGDYIYNGIDRKDNDKGYTIENSVPCCITCNMAKNSLTIQEFKDWVKIIYNKMYGVS